MTPKVYVAFTWRCCINGLLSKRGGSLASGPSAVPEKFIVLFVFKKSELNVACGSSFACCHVGAGLEDAPLPPARCSAAPAPHEIPSRAVAAFFPEDMR